MSSEPYWPLPPRLDTSADSTELVRWHLRLAVACIEEGTNVALANLLGVTPNVVNIALHRGYCTIDLAKRIEGYFGRKYFPRELFCPELELPVE